MATSYTDISSFAKRRVARSMGAGMMGGNTMTDAMLNQASNAGATSAESSNFVLSAIMSYINSFQAAIKSFDWSSWSSSMSPMMIGMVIVAFIATVVTVIMIGCACYRKWKAMKKKVSPAVVVEKETGGGANPRRLAMWYGYFKQWLHDIFRCLKELFMILIRPFMWFKSNAGGIMTPTKEVANARFYALLDKDWSNEKEYNAIRKGLAYYGPYVVQYLKEDGNLNKANMIQRRLDEIL